MSTPIESLDELHLLISEGRVGQDEALRLLRAWKNGAPAIPATAEDPGATGEDRGTAAGATADAGDLAEQVCEVVVEKVCGLLKVDPTDLDVDVELSEYGLDSLIISQLVNLVNESLGLDLVPTVLFEHPTLRAFSAFVAAEHGPSLAAVFGTAVEPEPVAPQQIPAAVVAPPPQVDRRPPPAAAPPDRPAPATVPAAPTRPAAPTAPAAPTRPAPATGPGPAAPDPDDDPIAIVGISGRFPQADDLDEYWENLRDGRDCIGEVPADRWDWRAHWGDPRQEPGRTNVKHGGFMDGVADFDPLFFGIAPKDAVHMDPQQRLLMLYVWKAIEDAGYSADDLAGSDLGLFIGTNDTGYGLLSDRSAARGRSVTPTGSVPSVGPNRMSYFLDVHGPSEPVETACSSSLVAIHRGVAAIERGECAMAVVGGINTIVVPDGHVSFSRSGMLSEDGRCKTFSAGADGYGRGEGVGMLVLKRLSAAERDGDHVHGLVRATAENHGGRANSLTSPNPKAQAAVIRRAYAKAGIDPRTVGYVEAHGTGTELGDPIEINGLKEAFTELYAGEPVTAAHCGLGSVKTNIGHLELAAGIAGVLKVLLQLRHRTLVRSLHAEEVNPYIDLDGSPFHLVRENQEWAAPRGADGRELPRRAGVSSFGFGGVNAHVVLEEHVPRAEQPAPAAGPVAIVLSAATPETLEARVRRLAEHLDAGRIAEQDLPNLAYTLQVGRVAMPERIAFLAHSVAEVRKRIATHLAGEKAHGLHRARAERRGPWSELVGDDDIAVAIDSWVAKGKLGRLLKLWVTGFDFDWRRLHTGRSMRRLPLPTYPFRLQRYWIADGVPAPDESSALPEAAPKPAAAPRRSGGPHRRELHAEDFYLRDHRVGGTPTLPGAAYLEFARDALGADRGVRLRDVTWLRPLAVTDPRSVRVELDPATDRFEVRADESGAVHAQGTALVDPALTGDAEVHDVEALRAICPARHAGAEIYALFDRMGMGYGPAFQPIEELHRGEDLAVARLRLPAAATGSFPLNPSMLDGALQTTLGLVLGEQSGEPGVAALPFAVREVQLLGHTPSSGWAVVRRAADDRRDSGVRRLDVDLCDEDGAVRVRVLGFSTRPQQGAASTPAPVAEAERAPEAVRPAETGRAPEVVRAAETARAAETGDIALLLEPAWRSAPAPADAPDQLNHHVVLCELPDVDATALGGLLGGGCEHWQGTGSIEDRYTGYAQRLLELIRDQARQPAPRLVQVVTPAEAPWLGGLSGMLRTAYLEHPKLRTQWIELGDRPGTADLADRLRRDAADTEQEAVRHRDGDRRTSRWREIPEPAPELPWRDGGVYLITGGAGGLGALAAEEIAARVQSPALVLCGRSPAGPDQEDLLARLRAAGAKADYRSLDVADRDAVCQAVREVEAQHGALHGVLHAAGVLRDGFLARKSAADVRDVFAAKVTGLRHLDEATAHSALDCFIGYSSMAAFGNVGQADYAAANAFMDGYAAHREALVADGERSGRTLVVNWPLWDKGGMGGDASTVTLLESVGMRPMRARVGIDALHRAWAARVPQVIALDGDLGRLRERFAPASTAVPAEDASAARAVEPAPDAGSGPGTAPEPDSGSGATAADLAPVVADLMSSLLEIDPAELPPDAPLRDYGFDSIFMMQFLTQAQTHIDAGLTLDVIADCDTLEDVTAAIAAATGAQAESAVAEPPVAEPVPAEPVQAEPVQAEPVQAEPVPPLIPAPRTEAVPAAHFPELVRMNGVTAGRPIFWVHHGNGGVESYAPVAARARRPFYGIQPKGWIDDTEILTGQIPMAEFYAGLILSVQPEGPYDIGGFSLGGLFAYEVVRQLQLRGAEVRTLVMLDTLDADSTNRANEIIVGGDFSPEVVSKVSDFRAANLILGNNSFESHSGGMPILRRDEVDTTLDGPAFLDSLIAKALERGVKKTESQLRSRVRQLSRYLEATQAERYELHPLPKPDGPSCYYLRNASREFFGAFRDYMVLFPNDALPTVDGTDYWLGWPERLDDFFTIDVDTSMHSEVMTAPASLEKLLRLCDRLYGPEGGR
ncbi:SDR family NAD(P)-dependent oxidoreductase [Saccharopolyspora sp. 7B]|uniref:SDR family NAD(P)-dependent oxidoreductase n=1 Tax=Saccharopolyspora sp. 7B TaxID=2877240 RepID=UPI001CD747AF|nr:SDR family NAD(P)-dependent oxidoreductase [Saccharopolyspora sp. 7B]MCA1281213.1 SDR family NAD(P)-dependent oxidoreductase [Saccharopolyspora sp. 7B]